MSAKQQHQRRRSNTSNASAETWHTLENFLNQEPGAPGSSSNARGSSLYPGMIAVGAATAFARSTSALSRQGGEATVEEASNEAHESDVESKGSGTTQKSKTSTASTAATAVLVTDENGNPIPTEGSKDLTSVASTSMTSKESKPDDFKEHEFKTGLTMFLIGNMWIVHLFVICGFSWIMTMYVPQVRFGLSRFGTHSSLAYHLENFPVLHRRRNVERRMLVENRIPVAFALHHCLLHRSHPAVPGSPQIRSQIGRAHV